jgi:hypothetical protein
MIEKNEDEMGYEDKVRKKKMSKYMWKRSEIEKR